MKTIVEESATSAAPATEEQPRASKKGARAPRRAPVAPAKGKSGKETTPAKKAPKGAKTAKAAKPDTGWQPHSVRGFLSGTVGRR